MIGIILFVLLLLIATVAAVIVAMLYHHRLAEKLLDQSLDLVTLLVTMPKEQRAKEQEQGRDFKELISVMEPVLSIIEPLYTDDFQARLYGQPSITFEMAAHSDEVWFYVKVPKDLRELIEKQIHAQYPAAQIDETDDYRLFRETGKGEPGVAGAELQFNQSFHLPIKGYTKQESDPLNALTNAMSKIKAPDSAAIQVVVTPAHESWRNLVEQSARSLQEGKGLHEDKSVGKTIGKEATTLASGIVKQAIRPDTKKDELRSEKPKTLSPLEEEQLKLLNEKASKGGFAINVRLIAISQNEAQATAYLNSLVSAFSSFTLAGGNGFSVKKKPVKRLIKEYLLASFIRSSQLIVNTEELSTLFHFPTKFVDTPNIHWLFSRRLPPPANLPTEGTLVGESVFRGETKKIFVTPSDRLRHLYMIGKTGVGKTVLFEHLALQDIRAGHGCAYIDPNGDAIEYLLTRIPKERAEDVIIFDPSDIDRPMGLNLLEWKTNEERDFLVQESISIFYRLFDPGKTGIIGPQFEHWFRNAALTIMSYPGGGTLVEIPRLFVDEEFKDDRVKHVTDPIVRAFWEKQMAQTSASSKSEMLNYFTSKFGRFITNDMMRNIIGQSQSAFSFRDVMDNKKILLINLSKGLIGEINAQLLGMILVAKLQMAAFSRQDQPEESRVPFYLYVDEFQNFTTEVFATILSEARKYGLSLNITNQFIGQLPENIRDAVFGNAGTIITWRVGAQDAEFLTKELEPLSIDDMVNLEKYNFYIRLLIDNAPQRPFNVRGMAPDPTQNSELGSALRQLSRLKFGKDRRLVEQEVEKRGQLEVAAGGGVAEGALAGVK